MKKGLIHIYTGGGKGKTTASFGLALRSLGQNKKVIIYQFLKPPKVSCGEKNALEKLKHRIEIVRLKQIHPVFKKELTGRKLEKYEKKLKKKIEEDFQKIEQDIEKENFDLVVLDEVMNVLSEGYLKNKEVIKFLKNKPQNTEIVLTGRKANRDLTNLADYVTQMKAVKHPYKKGIKARRGIEY